MPDDRLQVCVYVTDSMGDETGDSYTAVNWPLQDVRVDGIPSREAAPAAFLPVYNGAKSASLAEADCRFFGPLWSAANVRQVADEWEAACVADKPYRVTAPTEDEAKAAFLEYFYVEYSKVEPTAFPVPLADRHMDWTYNPDG